MKTKKYCPLSNNKNMSGHDWARCIQSRCGVWDESNNQCGLKPVNEKTEDVFDREEKVLKAFGNVIAGELKNIINDVCKPKGRPLLVHESELADMFQHRYKNLRNKIEDYADSLIEGEMTESKQKQKPKPKFKIGQKVLFNVFGCSGDNGKIKYVSDYLPKIRAGKGGYLYVIKAEETLSSDEYFVPGYMIKGITEADGDES